MNAKPTALDAYLARTVAIHAKLERLQQLADDHFGHAWHSAATAKTAPSIRNGGFVADCWPALCR